METMSAANEPPEPHKLAPFNPSSETAQRQSIALMDLKNDDILFDLGCGDARLLIRAASEVEGLFCVGVEIDPVFVDRANKVIAELPAQVQERIQIRCQDVNQVLSPKEGSGNTMNAKHDKRIDDLVIDDATVVYLYLLPRGLRHIKDMLDDLVKRRVQNGGSIRVVAYTFQVQGWEPVRVDTSTKSGVPIYLYQFPPNP